MLLFEKESSILFTGDSVTDAGREHPVGENGIPGLSSALGTGYVSLIDTFLNVYYPELSLHVRNTGISGNSSRDLLARWQQDVIALAPDYLVVMIGINDLWRRFDSPGVRNWHVLEEEYEQNLRSMVAQTKDKVKEMIFLTPYFIEPNRQDAMRVMTDSYRAICKKVCAETDVRCIDLQQAFDDYLQYRHPCYIMWDRVHPGRIGSMIIARAFLKEMGFDKPVI